MSIDFEKYPMLAGGPPVCAVCDEPLRRLEAFALWYCTDDYCDNTPETDAEVDNRLQANAEAAYERRLQQ